MDPYEIAFQELKSKNYEKAIFYFTKVVERNKRNWKATFLLGEAQILKGKKCKTLNDIENGIETMKKGIELNPGSIRSLIKLGHYLFDVKLYKEAIIYYNRAKNLKPDIVIKNDNDIVSYRESGQLDIALDMINERLETNETEVRQRRKIKILMKMKIYMEAFKIIEELLSKKIKDGLYDKRLVDLKRNILYNKGKEEELLDFYQDLIRLYPKETNYISGKFAANFTSFGRHEISYGILKNVQPKDIDTLSRMAFSLSSQGLYEDSLNHLNEIDEVDRSGWILGNIAYCLQKTGQIAPAIDYYEKALNADNHWNHHFELARCYFKTGKQDEGIKHLNQAIYLEPNRPRLWIEIGRISYETGDIKQSMVYYQRAIALGDTSTIAHRGLAYTFIQLKDYKQAQRHIEIALNAEQDNPAIAQEYGFIVAKNEDAETINKMETAFQEDIENMEVQIQALEEELQGIYEVLSQILKKDVGLIKKVFLKDIKNLDDEEIEVEMENLFYNIHAIIEEELKQKSLGIEHIQEQISSSYKFSHRLGKDSLFFLATGDYLLEVLGPKAKLDFSPVILEYCKSVEMEMNMKLFEKFRDHMIIFLDDHKDLKDDIDHEKIKVFRKFYSDEKPITLGEMAFIMNLLSGKNTLAKSKLLQTFKLFIEEKYREPGYFLDKANLPNELEMITNDYRNPSAHTKRLNYKTAKDCREAIVALLEKFSEAI